MTTATEVRRTPTPWSVDDSRPMIYVMGTDGETIASFDRRSVEEANAAFIVRAVNAHEKLLIALQHLKMLVGGLKQEIKIPKDGAAIIVASDVIQRCEEAILNVGL